MWVPATEAEIQAAIDAGTLRESPTFDAKAALPPLGRNKDLAKDICAMTPDGGVLLYGLGGDDPTRPDRRHPFDLTGAAERIDQVAQTAISEPPVIEIRDIRSDEQDGLGYLAVVVPASPRAPHMLTIDGDNRFWGRGETGNRILTEGEVARLYARRERWEIDRGRLLDQAIENFPFRFEEPREHVGPMVVITQPVIRRGDLLAQAAQGAEIRGFLQRDLTQRARATDPYPDQGTSGLGDALTVSRQGADVWVLSNERDPAFPYQARLALRVDGTATYWHAPTINHITDRGPERLLLMERSVTRALHQHLDALGWLYECAGYVGMVDVALSVLDIEQATAATALHTLEGGTTYGDANYRRDARVTMIELRNVEAVVRSLLAPLYEVISVRNYDPYTGA